MDLEGKIKSLFMDMLSMSCLLGIQVMMLQMQLNESGVKERGAGWR